MSTVESAAPSALAKSVFECLNDHDANRLRQFHADEIVEEWPIVGRMQGGDAVRDHFAAMFAAMPDFHIDIDRMAADGETVFVQWHATGTFSGGPFEGVSATGKHIDIKGNNCMTIRDGKVVSDFTAYDGMTYAAQAGLLPRHGSALDHVLLFGANAMTRTRKLVSLAAEKASERIKSEKGSSSKGTSEKASEKASEMAETLTQRASDAAENLRSDRPPF